MFNRRISNRRSTRSTLIHSGPGPIRSGPSSTRRPLHIPTRTRAINSAALHPERCTDRGVSAVPGDTWPTCSLSLRQLGLHDQVDLDTLTAELLAGGPQAFGRDSLKEEKRRRLTSMGKATRSRRQVVSLEHSLR